MSFIENPFSPIQRDAEIAKKPSSLSISEKDPEDPQTNSQRKELSELTRIDHSDKDQTSNDSRINLNPSEDQFIPEVAPWERTQRYDFQESRDFKEFIPIKKKQSVSATPSMKEPSVKGLLAQYENFHKAIDTVKEDENEKGGEEDDNDDDDDEQEQEEEKGKISEDFEETKSPCQIDEKIHSERHLSISEALLASESTQPSTSEIQKPRIRINLESVTFKSYSDTQGQKANLNDSSLDSTEEQESPKIERESQTGQESERPFPFFNLEEFIQDEENFDEDDSGLNPLQRRTQKARESKLLPNSKKIMKRENSDQNKTKMIQYKLKRNSLLCEIEGQSDNLMQTRQEERERKRQLELQRLQRLREEELEQERQRRVRVQMQMQRMQVQMQPMQEQREDLIEVRDPLEDQLILRVLDFAII